ncbi:hypothetical protein [Actinoplanes aureus]|uniref:Uncharacterized protein n=1 Tax=Actinoplanes aureus TaxID=2792083 RepID=A0A931CPK5_9ACTN|nr:hypothetical protein [Actinoplanes aureus]MBG0568735.1 hypothetical protein [Actinoplanes aureus]
MTTVQALLRYLREDLLFQQTGPGRYTFHDLIRAYATSRAHDEDRPPERRTALTRLFDYYVAATATAVNNLHPAEARWRPAVPASVTPSRP